MKTKKHYFQKLNSGYKLCSLDSAIQKFSLLEKCGSQFSFKIAKLFSITEFRKVHVNLMYILHKTVLIDTFSKI